MLSSSHNHFFLLIILYLLSIFRPIVALLTSSIPTIDSVSTSISSIISPSGPISGGTDIYIMGRNFITDPTLISLAFGAYPCLLSSQSLTSTMIICTTSPSYKEISNLPLTLNVTGQPSMKCTAAYCAFSYQMSSTPFVHEIYPKTAK